MSRANRAKRIQICRLFLNKTKIRITEDLRVAMPLESCVWNALHVP